MSAGPQKLDGAAVLSQVADRLRPFGAEGASLFDKQGRTGGVRRPVSTVAPRRPMRAPNRQAEALTDVHFDGVHLIVTTEIDDPCVQASVEDARLILRSAAPERVLTLPCRVKPGSLSVRVVNGILEATMAPEDFSG